MHRRRSSALRLAVRLSLNKGVLGSSLSNFFSRETITASQKDRRKRDQRRGCESWNQEVDTCDNRINPPPPPDAKVLVDAKVLTIFCMAPSFAGAYILWTPLFSKYAYILWMPMLSNSAYIFGRQCFPSPPIFCGRQCFPIPIFLAEQTSMRKTRRARLQKVNAGMQEYQGKSLSGIFTGYQLGHSGIDRHCPAQLCF